MAWGVGFEVSHNAHALFLLCACGVGWCPFLWVEQRLEHAFALNKSGRVWFAGQAFVSEAPVREDWNEWE